MIKLFNEAKPVIQFIEHNNTLEKELTLGYNCKVCGMPIYGTFKTDKAVDMSRYESGMKINDNAAHYKSSISRLPDGSMVQLFKEVTHRKSVIFGYEKCLVYNNLVVAPNNDPELILSSILSQLMFEDIHMYEQDAISLDMEWKTLGKDLYQAFLNNLIFEINSVSPANRPAVSKVPPFGGKGPTLYLLTSQTSLISHYNFVNVFRRAIKRTKEGQNEEQQEAA